MNASIGNYLQHPAPIDFPSPGGRGLRGGGSNQLDFILLTLTQTLSRQGRGNNQSFSRLPKLDYNRIPHFQSKSYVKKMPLSFTVL
jgi:hypothetical protein